jgi:hypothetical protein
MDTETTFKNLVAEFDLSGIPQENQEELLISLAQAVNTQFLLDVHKRIGEEHFAALEHSLSMGMEFYETTLKHLLPDYEEVFSAARTRVIDAYKKTIVPVVN